MGSALCGVVRGEDKAYRCPCCGMESDNLDAFATSMCWECAFNMNWECSACLDNGVEVAPFQRPGKVHLLREKKEDYHIWRTRCGVTVDPETWTGPGDREPCRRCHPYY